MRPELITTCERQFILDALRSDQRLDGRLCDDFRPVKLMVGAECGTSLCMMGSTKVFCAVSAALVEPSQSRPQKGIVTVEVDMSPMGNPANEHNRLGQKGMELTRLLELVLRDSRCVDVESLCVRTGQEVWKIRIDVKIMDDDGSLLDCATLAAVTALYHFRRPNVSVESHSTLIHTQWEQALVPLNIYHTPICVSFGFIEQSQITLVDPTEKEHQCVSGHLVVACNKRKEVCALHQSSSFTINTATLEACVKRAMQRANDLSELVQTVIQDDAKKRTKYEKPPGFETTITTDVLTWRETNPNELIAPCIDVMAGTSRSAAEVNSIVLNVSPKQMFMHIIQEDPLSAETKAVDNEDTVVTDQVNTIVTNVKQVNITDTSKSKRQQELEDVGGILEGLDDLEGDTMEL